MTTNYYLQAVRASLMFTSILVAGYSLVLLLGREGYFRMGLYGIGLAGALISIVLVVEAFRRTLKIPK